jgi:hypothetical protein
MYRDGTLELPGEAEGTGWSKVDGLMVWLSSGEGMVWAGSANGELWYRGGINQNNPMGSNWFKLEARPSVELFKLAVAYGGALWAIDAGENLRCKEKATQEHITKGNAVTLMDDCGNFKSFNIQEKPSSFRVMNGGWVVYEKPNFKGKCHYIYDGRLQRSQIAATSNAQTIATATTPRTRRAPS